MNKKTTTPNKRNCKMSKIWYTNRIGQPVQLSEEFANLCTEAAEELSRNGDGTDFENVPLFVAGEIASRWTTRYEAMRYLAQSKPGLELPAPDWSELAWISEASIMDAINIYHCD